MCEASSSNTTEYMGPSVYDVSYFMYMTMDLHKVKHSSKIAPVRSERCKDYTCMVRSVCDDSYFICMSSDSTNTHKLY